jgi:hypothetical protein
LYAVPAIGRENVTLVYETGVERPSDTNRILHLELDGTRRWRVTLVTEMEAVGLNVDWKALRPLTKYRWGLDRQVTAQFGYVSSGFHVVLRLGDLALLVNDKG